MKTNNNPNVVDLRASAASPMNDFTSVDVGAPGLKGSAKLLDGGWELIAGGRDIWERTDEFQYLFKQASSDFDIGVRVESFVPAHLYSKAGLMIRETLEPNSPHLMFLVFSNNEPRNNNLGAYEMQFRPVAGGDCQAIYPVARPPAPPEFPAAYPNSWLRVRRCGDRFSAMASSDGKTWKLYAEHSLALTRTVKVGPALTSHNPEVPAEAVFRDYTEFK